MRVLPPNSWNVAHDHACDRRALVCVATKQLECGS
jgi:hypothetical protein